MEEERGSQLADQRILEIDMPVQTFRNVEGRDSSRIGWHPGSLTSGYRIDIIGPVLRICEDAEKVAICFRYHLDDEENKFLLWEELSTENQRTLRQMFPDCDLLMPVY